MREKPIKGEFLEILLRSPQTIFSNKDVSLLWNESDRHVVGNRLKKYAKLGKLVRVRNGFYAKDNNYNIFELATRIYTPSYISFETVLAKEGVNFQYYGNIFVASYLTRDIFIGKQRISFLKMKDGALSSQLGIQNVDGVAEACKERAMLDRIYVSKQYYFDNLEGVDWKMISEILPIYENKKMKAVVTGYLKEYQNYTKENK
jgi:hypothetical protein